jgi:P27 family predicted phage terminase small subunit
MPRRHKPALLKIIEGSKRLPRQPEPQPEGVLDEPPAWLTESQKEGWRYAIANAPPELLRLLDRGVLTVFVVAEDLHRQAALEVQRHGMLVKTPRSGEPMQSPYLSIQNRQGLIMMKAIAEMGFSPSSRSGIATGRGSSNTFSNNGRRPDPAA